MPAVAQHHLLDVPHSESVDVNQPGADLLAPLDVIGVELDCLAILDDDDPRSAVAQPHLLDVPHSESVDVNQPGADLLAPLDVIGVELDCLAILDDDDPVFGHARLTRDLGVQQELAVLAVDRNEVARPRRVEHLAQLVPLRVTCYVHVAHLRVEDASAVAVQVVDSLVEHSLVTRNRPRRDHDPIASQCIDEWMALRRKPCERRHRLALAARGGQQQLRGRDVGDGLQRYWPALPNFAQGKLARRLEVRLEAAADHSNLPLELRRQADQVLDPVDVGGEVGHHDATWGLTENLLERRVQVAFRPRTSRAFGVGRIAEQQPHPFLTDRSEASHIGRKAVGRVGVQLEVARVNDLADGGVDREGDRIGDGVADGHRLHAERPELDLASDSHLAEVRLAKKAMLLQLGLDQTERQPCPEDGDVDLLQRVGQASAVVLVTVGEEDAKNFTIALQQVRDVRQHEVDSGHVFLGEHEAGVDDQDLAVPFEGPHVYADLAQAAQRDIPKSRRTHSRRSCSASCFGGSTGTGGGGGARSLARYAFTRSKSCSRSATSEPLCSAAAGWYSGT